MTLKLVLDRYEGNTGVCLDFDDKRYLIDKEILAGAEINDIFTIEFDGEKYHSLTILHEETQRKKDDISKRMKKLFKISKNRRPPKI